MTEPASSATDPDASGRAPADLEAVVRREPMHSGDRVPDWLLRMQVSILGRVSPKGRLVIGITVAVFAVIVVMAIAAADVLGIVVDDIGLLAYAGLFLASWLGNGGALVPIPGLRLFALLMLFQQAIALAPIEAMLVAAAGMSLGLLSYYLAGAAGARHQARTPTSADASDDRAMISKQADDAAIEGTATSDASTKGAMSTWLSSHRLTRRFLDSLHKGQARARPVIERRGISGLFLLCVAPSALATAGALVSGSIGFGFGRFLLAAFSSKLVLAAIVTLAALLVARL